MLRSIALLAVLLAFVAARLPCDSQDSDFCNSEIEGSECVSDFCDCKPGYVFNSDVTKCLKISDDTYNGECTESVQCGERLMVGVECANGKCQCVKGYHYLHGRCFKTSGYKESCAENENCYSGFSHETTTCKNDSCECADNTYLLHGHSCRLTAGPGEECGIDEDCQAVDPETVCVDNICESASNYKRKDRPVATPNTTVVKVVKILSSINHSRRFLADCDNCSEPGEQCNDYNTCICKIGYFRDRKGVCKLELGEVCTDNAECEHIPYGECRDSNVNPSSKTCECKGGTTPDPSNQLCRLPRKLHYSCANGANCVHYGDMALCQDYKCECGERSRFIEDEQYCWPIKGMSEECSDSLDCFYEGSACVDGSCACADGYHQSSNKDSCNKNVDALGDICSEDTDCSVIIGFSECPDGKCACSTGYFGDSSGSTCLAGVGSTCENNEMCAEVPGALCISKKCVCPSGTIGSSTANECLEPAPGLGGNCTDVAQCSTVLGEFSSCSDGVCMCNKGYHFNYGSCYLIKLLGSECTDGGECYYPYRQEAIECRNGLCQCSMDYNPSADNTRCNSGPASVEVTFWMFLYVLLMSIAV